MAACCYSRACTCGCAACAWPCEAEEPPSLADTFAKFSAMCEACWACELFGSQKMRLLTTGRPQAFDGTGRSMQQRIVRSCSLVAGGSCQKSSGQDTSMAANTLALRRSQRTEYGTIATRVALGECMAWNVDVMYGYGMSLKLSVIGGGIARVLLHSRRPARGHSSCLPQAKTPASGVAAMCIDSLCACGEGSTACCQRWAPPWQWRTAGARQVRCNKQWCSMHRLWHHGSGIEVWL